MTDDTREGWEPDPSKMGSWRAMFEQNRSGSTAAPSSPPPQQDDAVLDEPGPPDRAVYRPWLIQRGRSRSSPMLGLRKFDPRAGLWMGWGLPYSSLQLVEYLGDRMVSLDFGMRRFVLEGRGLDDLARSIKQGMVSAVQEYSSTVWPQAPEGPIILSIKNVSGSLNGT